MVTKESIETKVQEIPSIQKWEYKTEFNEKVFSDEILNKFGSEGWELCSCVPGKQSVYYYYTFKRLKYENS